jgi:hypothetical protein
MPSNTNIAKTNVILFIIVIILSLIAWYQPGLQQTVVQYLTSLKVKDINSILIERHDIGSIKLKKQENGWFLQEPYHLPANPPRVSTITALAEKRSYSQFQANDDELTRYHLKDPLVSIWLNEEKVVIGSEDPIKRQRYAMNISDNINSGNNTLHLINGVIFYQLRANLDTFISLALLPPQSKIRSIAWSDKRIDIDSKGLWQLTPDSPNITADKVAQFIQSWQHAQAKKVSTSVSFSISNEELLKSPAITISYFPFAKTNIEKIHYLIIQDDQNIKLFRTDIQIAYSISPELLNQLTGLFSEK